MTPHSMKIWQKLLELLFQRSLIYQYFIYVNYVFWLTPRTLPPSQMDKRVRNNEYDQDCIEWRQSPIFRSIIARLLAIEAMQPSSRATIMGPVRPRNSSICKMPLVQIIKANFFFKYKFLYSLGHTRQKYRYLSSKLWISIETNDSQIVSLERHILRNGGWPG